MTVEDEDEVVCIFNITTCKSHKLKDAKKLIGKRKKRTLWQKIKWWVIQKLRTWRSSKLSTKRMSRSQTGIITPLRKRMENYYSR